MTRENLEAEILKAGNERLALFKDRHPHAFKLQIDAIFKSMPNENVDQFIDKSAEILSDY